MADVAPTISTRTAVSGGIDPPPEGGRETGIAMRPKALELGKERSKALGTHAGVLGRIDGAAGRSYDGIPGERAAPNRLRTASDAASPDPAMRSKMDRMAPPPGRSGTTH